MLLALTSFIACSLAAAGFQLHSRTILSQAVCLSNFSWANNSMKQSPCDVAALVNAPCNNGNWIIPALNSSVVYSPPSSSGGTLTPCTCSWASYNLISACTDCQGFSNQTTSWAAYSISCSGFLTNNTYFPPDETLLQNTFIPFWATTNPINWPGQQFNAAAAQNISNEGIADVGSTTPTSTSASTSTSTSTSTSQPKPIGAIVGGVIGGVVVLLTAVILGIYLLRRSSRLNNVTDPSPLLMNHTHLRSHSDITAVSNNMSTPNMSTPIGYTSLSSSPMRPSTPTIRTHASTSIRSFPFFSSGGSSTVSPSVRQQSPPPVSTHRDETAVEPFRLAPVSNYNPDRKQANGAYPVYDQPTAPPTMRVEVRSTTPIQGGRTRYNPPAYTEPTNASPEIGGRGSPSSHRSPPTVGQTHGKKSSADTQHSGGSAPRVAGGNPARGNLAPPGTVRNPQASSSVNVLTGHGRQLSGDANIDRKRRPDTEENFSVRDIA